MKSSRLSAFERAALASSLLNEGQLEKAWAALMEPKIAAIPRDTSLSVDERLANTLVQMGLLNTWQAKQLLAGRTRFNLGPYCIVDSIGSGGMGQVFKAEHGVMGRVVAVKVLPRNKCTPEAIDNFTREIRAQAKLDHPNLVRALDAGHDGKVYYLVTEYVPGADLHKLVRRSGPLSMESAASVLSQTAAGLQHAHERGLIHRDVKPSNVLVTPDGHAKLSDLGLAGPLSGDSDPRFGRIVGTADYLSPDHIQSPCNPTPAWDIYSLGCTLYYAVTGKVPFPGGSTADKANAHCKLRPLDPRRLNPNLSGPFIDVLADMMAKDPAERISSAAEVIRRLAAWVNPPARLAPPSPGNPGKLQANASFEASAAIPGGNTGDREKVHLEDTATGFPDLSDLARSPVEGPSELSQATDPVASAAQETHAELAVAADELSEPISFSGPLLVLVLFPGLLVAVILVIWWVSHRL
ncbi:MAG: serine/threonine-protein kinase [Thermoguttaceae bacterium]